ncbi:MAG: AcrB/AcrD/AcrF family protein, partial [Deltaproteobacteria bacterium]
MQDSDQKSSGHKLQGGSIAWMAGNSVAANLMMAVLLIGGLFMGFNIKQEVFPEFSLDRVNISVAYPGASPEEVETGILLSIEEAIQDLEGVDEITATANEGFGSISVETMEGTNINRLWQEIKSEVDRIGTFPQEAEEPQVSIAARKREVLKLALYGDASETTMRSLADRIQDKLLMDEGITQVELDGVRDREIQIEI